MSTQTDKIRGALMIAAADSGASRMVRSWAVDALSALSELEAQPAQDAGMTDLSETELWVLIWKRWPAKGQDTMTPELRQGAHDFYVYLCEQGRLPKGRASEGDDAATSKLKP